MFYVAFEAIVLALELMITRPKKQKVDTDTA